MTAGWCFFFVFMVFWRPQDWLVPWLSGYNILDFVVFMALFSFIVEKDEGKARIPVETPQIRLFFGLWIAVLMSHIANTYLQGLLDCYMTTFKMCFFTGLLYCVLDRPARLRRISQIYVIMAMFMSYHALLQQSRGYGFAGGLPVVTTVMDPFGEWQEQLRSQFFGIFEDPNDLAQILGTSLPLAFCMTKRKSFFSLVLGCLISWLLVKGILATHSRGGLVGMITGMSVIIALILPAKWLPVLMFGLLGGWAMICPLATPYLDESAHDRVVFWGLANQMFKTHPLFGIGYGMFWEVADSRAAHNAYVFCYTELGFFGYWFWWNLLQNGFVYAWRTRVLMRRVETEEQKWMKMFTGLSIAAMGSFAASSYFLSRAFVYPCLFLFAILGAIPVAAGAVFSAEDGYTPSMVVKTKQDLMVTGTIGAVVSIFYIYMTILLLNKAYGGGG